uniref:TFIIS N-terminal domain-containing protein n=1 Tax=Octactis speculum TaxID=3111310 RepID=A0A6U3V691_9STRA|mmetsp:Transcript_43180/g.59004  ORF Transcript_43180/g.59004 Transcript_43180/m.59004 type:complete len:315 (+) Transcript_43180:15-959(+)
MDETPVLRGNLSIKDGRYIITGKWAFSSDAFKEGDTSKFFLSAPAPDGAELPPGDGVEKFKGYFMMRKEGEEGGKIKVKEKKVKFSFEKGEGTKYHVNGRGSNQYGDFNLAGMFDSTSGRLALTKSYLEDEEVDADIEEDVEDDEEGIVEDLDADEVAQEIADLRADAAETLGVQIDISTPSESRKRRAGGLRAAAAEDGDGGGKRRKEATTMASSEAKTELLPTWDLATLEEHTRRLTEAQAANSVPDLLDVLGKLGDSSQRVTVDLLRTTGLGRVVKPLKKHSDKSIAEAAARIVSSWRQVVQNEDAAKSTA